MYVHIYIYMYIVYTWTQKSDVYMCTTCFVRKLDRIVYP